jgi:hypothetical protein
MKINSTERRVATRCFFIDPGDRMDPWHGQAVETNVGNLLNPKEAAAISTNNHI